MTGLEWCRLDSAACTHPAPAALLRLMGSSLFCGHCGADLPEFLHHTVIRCDGSVVRITQSDFGTLHVCGQDDIAESIEELLSLVARATTCGPAPT